MNMVEYEFFMIEETHKMIEGIIDIVSNIIAKLDEVEEDND